MSRKKESNQDDYVKKESKKSVKDKRSIVFRIICAVYIILTVLFFGYIISINMLPTTYLVILAAVILIITGGLSFGIVKKQNKMVINIICSVIACIILAIYGGAYYYLDHTFKFIDTMSNVSEQVEEYYVIANSNSNLKAITDIKKENLYMFATQEDISDVKNDLKTKSEVTFKEEDNLDTLSTKLLKGKIDLILLSSSQYSMIVDEKENFVKDTKIIYTAVHKIKTVIEPETNKEEKSNQKIEDGVFNVYISGIDTSGSINNVSRSDANIIATINTKTHEVLLTSIPRDYYVTLHSKQAKDKLTHSGIYGINETLSTIEDLLEIDINYYVRVNFTTLIKVVDAIGGIDVNSDMAFSTVGYNFTSGNNHLNGNKALAFSRERHAFADGDRQRGKNQQKVIAAIIDKLTSSTTILTKYSNILSSLSSSFQTNIAQKDISALVKGQLDNMTSWTITNVSLDGAGSKATTYSAGSQKLYVMIPDQATVNDAKTKINTLLNNK
ncbi:MAG: LCP family protein [Clostridia bacterium]